MGIHILGEEVFVELGFVEAVVEGVEEEFGVGGFVFRPDEAFDSGLHLGLAAGDAALGFAAGFRPGFAVLALAVADEPGFEGEGLADGAGDAVEGAGEACGLVRRLGRARLGVEIAGEAQAQLGELAEDRSVALGYFHEQK
ncbi:MAG: hypothetical protein E7812_15310 [Phenylobacterium sp.]|nr:MAG: hypothetical protein E7812_15310 [Phenylobacterium sp.]